MKIQSSWQYKKLLAFNLFALCWFALWYFPPVSQLWRWIDLQAFIKLNHFLTWGEQWQTFWALTNKSGFDYYEFLLLTVVVIFPGFLFAKETYRRAFVGLVLAVLASYLLKFICTQYLSLHRASPSKVVDGTILIKQLVPSLMPIKYSSSNSFPGDHAAVILTWGLFVWLYAKRPQAYFAVALAIFLCLPRLVVGAHWLSDELVGGLCIALLSVAWVIYTPILNGALALLEKL